MSCNVAKSVLGGSDNCYSNTSNLAEENKRKFYLELQNASATFCKIKYDKCIYNGNEERCDYLFTVTLKGEIHEWIFVELKGQNITKAFNQISAAIKQVGQKNIKGVKASAFVVSSKVPKAARTDIQKAKDTFTKRHGFIPEVENNKCTYRAK